MYTFSHWVYNELLRFSHVIDRQYHELVKSTRSNDYRQDGKVDLFHGFSKEFFSSFTDIGKD